jgi:hypothetical protein
MNTPRYEDLHRLILWIDAKGCPNCARRDGLVRCWADDAGAGVHTLEEITCLHCHITWTLR